MTEATELHPLQPGDRAPNVVLDAITRDGKIAIDDFRGKDPCWSACSEACIAPFAGGISPPKRCSIRRCAKWAWKA